MDEVARVSTDCGELRVYTAVFADGERCPMLVDAHTGVPLFDPTVWTMTKYRRQSAATMEQALRGAMLLHLFCGRRAIDMDARVRDGTFFSASELDDLADKAGLPIKELQSSGVPGVRGAEVHASGRRKINFLRSLPSATRTQAVESHTGALRLAYLREYLLWLGNRRSFQIGRDAPVGPQGDRRKTDYDDCLRKVGIAISLRAVGGSARRREGLSAGQVAELLRVIDPECPDNPWKTPFARARNQLIVLWLLMTGMRRGELLSRRVRDVQLPLSQVAIVRSPDDKRDPRRRQPLVKTRGRLVGLEPQLVVQTGRYISDFRRKIESARRHGFLFVSKDGAPLSFAALDLLFADLRRAKPAVGPVTAHVLRHTWNETFSNNADLIGMGDEEERRLRSEIMGWSQTSKMPEYYLRRKTARKATEVSRQVQKRLFGLAKKNPAHG